MTVKAQLRAVIFSFRVNPTALIRRETRTMLYKLLLYVLTAPIAAAPNNNYELT
jgi:hypothetical protein